MLRSSVDIVAVNVFDQDGTITMTGNYEWFAQKNIIVQQNVSTRNNVGSAELTVMR
jgi:hypothetical protein